MLRSPLRPLLRPLLRSPTGLGSTTLTQKAIAILRKYGTNAHIYLPGVGTLSGITAGNYLDSAGTTAATVDNPVGLSLDALQAMTPGSELVTNGDFASGTTGFASAGIAASTMSVISGEAQVIPTVGYGRQIQTITCISGQTYQISCKARVISGGSRAFIGITTSSVGVSATTIGNTSSGTQVPLAGQFVASATTMYLVFGDDLNVAGGTLGFDDISIKQIPGIHATQATTANKPILRQSGGKYSWQFDGSNDSLSLSAPLFQMSDDHAVIAGFKADAANKYIFSHSNSVTATQCCSLCVDASGYPGAVWIDDASANALPTASTSCIGLSTVATAIKIGNAKRLRVNGVQAGATNNTALGVGTTNSYAIGRLNGSSGNFQGSIYPVIAIKGAVTDSDLLTLERFVGQLSGVSL